ncbi:MAG: helix-turn-helix transcriptional regulator [Casimicrobium sp.]
MGSSPERLLDTRAVASWLGLSAGTLESDRHDNKSRIPYLKIGRAVRYRESDVIKFLESCRIETEAQEAARKAAMPLFLRA